MYEIREKVKKVFEGAAEFRLALGQLGQEAWVDKQTTSLLEVVAAQVDERVEGFVVIARPVLVHDVVHDCHIRRLEGDNLLLGPWLGFRWRGWRGRSRFVRTRS